ncbi:MAG: S1 RNA-binding domain-containing protein [Anaerolineales bacterium]|nr:S1 RNA-binding domain-containing protein [Anaerolineales bacterium]
MPEERVGPPPMDESWWSAVLGEEEQHQPSQNRESIGYFGDKDDNRGTPEDWQWARELYETDDTVELSVIGYNRGGLLVEAQSLRGFVPVSHLVTFSPDASEGERTVQLANLVGTQLCLKVIEYDPDRGRLVLSERAAQAGPGKRAELLETLERGSQIHGTVTNITRFGVFVDLGGVEGLIHVSELSWGRVRHPADVVQCGQDVTVQVLSVDRDQGRVALSLKELMPDPWEGVEERYQIDDVVIGLVTNVVKFGAFVGIEDGLEGLIHVSELGDGSFLHPRSVVREGEQVRVRVIHIDASARRLGLSLRQVPQHTYDEPDPEVTPEHPEALSSF